MKWLTALGLSIVTLASCVSAHPGETHRPISKQELQAHEFHAGNRHAMARNCSSAIAEYQTMRKAKRSAELLSKRKRALREEPSAEPVDLVPYPNNDASKYTCVTAPEVTEGPYYINNELVRHDLTEDQTGTVLTIDIGVIDTSTCQPLPDVFVEIWNANATGVYGGFPATMSFPGGGTGGGGPPPPPHDHDEDPNKGPGKPEGGRKGGPGHHHASPAMVRNETWLRGGTPTDNDGVVTLTTIYPGYYAGRTAHIHTSVHAEWEWAENGTLISHAGRVIHVGQFFFTEEWNDAVYARAPYTSNPNKRTYNDDDGILDQERADGNQAFIELQLIEDDWEEGLLGFITMGVNPQASYPIDSTNYLSSDPLPTGRQCEDRWWKHSFVAPLFITALVIGTGLALYIIYRARHQRSKDGYIRLDGNANEQTAVE